MDWKAHASKIADVKNALNLMYWDQEIYMPEKSAGMRGQQIGTLSGILHELETDQDYFQALSHSDDPDAVILHKDLQQKRKLNRAHVEQLSTVTSNAFGTWNKAKAAKDFSLFAPDLVKILQLKRDECEMLGYEGHPYDAMLDQYDQGMTVKVLDQLFDDVKAKLTPFLKRLQGLPQPDDAFLYKHFDHDKQWDYVTGLLKKMGYDLTKGRQDLGPHPMCITIAPKDVRSVTRVNENDLQEMMFSSIHEGGHALYEQGLMASEYGLPTGEACSLSIHESQSRLYENNIGRSLPYWELHMDELKQVFPEQLNGVMAKDFFKAINKVQPSLIRTAADEVTYHFHIMIRYEIEKLLIGGDLEVADIPSKWNKMYKDYLGIDVPSDDVGCLQDIHWSAGLIGYFPTYSVGSIFAAQLMHAMEERLDVVACIRDGKMKLILDWLRVNVHVIGRSQDTNGIIESATGEALKLDYFMEYLETKYDQIY